MSKSLNKLKETLSPRNDELEEEEAGVIPIRNLVLHSWRESSGKLSSSDIVVYREQFFYVDLNGSTCYLYRHVSDVGKSKYVAYIIFLFLTLVQLHK